jgi:CheY-like chemotaxis protein
MPWVHARLVAEGKQHRSDRPDERRVISTGEVRSTDGAGEQRVAHEQIRPSLARSRDFQTHTARTVSRCVMRPDFELAEGNLLAWPVEAVDRREVGIHFEAKQQSLFDGLFVEEEIVAMQMNWCAEGTLGHAHTSHVVHMRVGQQDVRDRDVLARDELEKSVDFVTRIDEQSLARACACYDEAVLVERSDCLRLDYDHRVILAILDDLMFTSKIRAAAQQAGVTVAFARSAQSALEQMRSVTPALAIFDLNNPRTDPIGTITAMKADAILATIPTVGYVAHVDADTIASARAAGADEILARSAFVTQLPDILARAGT